MATGVQHFAAMCVWRLGVPSWEQFLTCFLSSNPHWESFSLANFCSLMATEKSGSAQEVHTRDLHCEHEEDMTLFPDLAKLSEQLRDVFVEDKKIRVVCNSDH